MGVLPLEETGQVVGKRFKLDVLIVSGYCEHGN